MFCNLECKNKAYKLHKVYNKCNVEQSHINDILSKRWELLYKIADWPLREKMYKIEQHLPISFMDLKK